MDFLRKSVTPVRHDLSQMQESQSISIMTNVRGETIHRPAMRSRRAIIVGWFCVVFGFGGFGVWAATAPLKSAVVAPGVLVVESKRRAIQHYEGGIVSEVLVQDGVTVMGGQVLIRLDPTRAVATSGQADARMVGALAEFNRIEAELEGVDSIKFAPTLLARAREPEVEKVISLQNEVFRARRLDLEQRRVILQRQVFQTQNEIEAIEAQQVGVTERLALQRERLAALRTLEDKGVSSRVQVNSVQADVADLTARNGDLAASRKAAGERLDQKKLEFLNVLSSYRAELATRLQAVQREYREAYEALLAAQDVSRRVEIRAPTSGKIVGLNYHTIGSVIPSGATIMEIVPEKDALLAEGMLRPQDVENVYPGLPVRVRLTAFSFRTTPPVPGNLIYISADRIVDPKSNQSGYLIRAELIPDGTAGSRHLKIQAGMPADIIVVKRERTMVDYLLDPILKVTERAFIER